MTYVTTIERRGIQKGIQKGEQKTLREGIVEILELRFQSVSYSIKKQIEEISDPAILRQLHRLAVQTESLEAFQKEIPK